MYKLAKPALLALRRALLRLEGRFDHKYIPPDVPAPRWVGPDQWQQHLQQLANKPGLRVLEIGSREVTGRSDARTRFAQATYVGFDYYPGPNVDVVGDAHRLSSYFEPGEKFDLIYSSACFEHFAMPWVVAQEMARLLKVGGTVFVETHFSFSSHERPWHFFQFSDMALKVLFSPEMGFECLDAGMSNPIVGRFSSLASPGARYLPVRGLYCHSEYLGRKVRDVDGFDWASADIGKMVADTHYPAP